MAATATDSCAAAARPRSAVDTQPPSYLRRSATAASTNNTSSTDNGDQFVGARRRRSLRTLGRLECGGWLSPSGVWHVPVLGFSCSVPRPTSIVADVTLLDGSTGIPAAKFCHTVPISPNSATGSDIGSLKVRVYRHLISWRLSISDLKLP